nr:cytochrome c biogenesis protein CcdA [Marinobacter goseongensis]
MADGLPAGSQSGGGPADRADGPVHAGLVEHAGAATGLAPGANARGRTPCIGPILGAILALSSTHANAETGMLYLAVYSLGLALPFLGTALFIEHFRKRVRGFSRWSRPLRALAGLVLIIMGIMVLTGQMTWFATWMLSTFPVLGRLG